MRTNNFDSVGTGQSSSVRGNPSDESLFGKLSGKKVFILREF